ncbi:MAG: pyrroloquinoline quinone-dependent dehydrogenase, partial [Vicinamibacterales bacterium]
MPRHASRFVLALVPLLLAPVVWTVSVAGQSGYTPSTAKGDWTHYTADVRGSKYSPLDQITAANFKDLEVAWRFKTDSFGTRPEYK